MAMIQCPGCGCDISEDVSKCPFCECVIKKDGTNTGFESEKMNNENHLYKNNDTRRYKYFAGLFFALACVCFIVAFTRVNNSKYNFYKEHYEECLNGYDDSKYAEYTSGLLFKGAYSAIADEYKKMADEDMNKIWKYRWQAIILVVGGAVFSISGCVFIKKRK